MTLSEIIRAIEDAAAVQPTVNMIVENDVFRLNSYADARYGVFVWTQGRHRGDMQDDFLRYSFTLFYIDRLRNDIANQVEVQSVGMSTIANVLNILRDQGIEPETFEYTTFNQRFSDECAGVFCSVILIADLDTVCSETGDAEIYAPGGWEQAAEGVIVRKF